MNKFMRFVRLAIAGGIAVAITMGASFGGPTKVTRQVTAVSAKVVNREPASLTLLGLGLVGAAGVLRRRPRPQRG